MQKCLSSGAYERRMEKFCPHCNAKLGWKEWHRKKHSVEIPCRRCGRAIPGDMVMIGNTKFPKGMIMKRF